MEENKTEKCAGLCERFAQCKHRHAIGVAVIFILLIGAFCAGRESGEGRGRGEGGRFWNKGCYGKHFNRYGKEDEGKNDPRNYFFKRIPKNQAEGQVEKKAQTENSTSTEKITTTSPELQ